MANFITRHIPNAITSLNLFCGCIAIVNAFNGDMMNASLFIVLGAIFDFFDGMSARLLKVHSAMGKELDSLADQVTFGLAPAVMVFKTMQYVECDCLSPFFHQFLPYTAFLIAVFSGIRLAKFNIDERQTTSFIGMPTPANALFWMGICVDIDNVSIPFLSNIWVLFALVVIFSFLLISEIPMFSFKFKSLSWSENKIRYLFAMAAVILLILLGITGICAVIVLYILTSIFSDIINKKKKG